MSNTQLPFWEKYHCLNCKKTIGLCDCDLLYCPFCDAKFGFVQDWNIHLIKTHERQLQTSKSVEGKN